MLVVTALASGAAGGVTQPVVTEGYQRLRDALAERFRGKPAAEIALAEHPASPQTWHAPLVKYLTETGVDDELLDLAEHLLDAVPEKSPAQVQVVAGTIQGQQVGDHNLQNNNW